MPVVRVYMKAGCGRQQKRELVRRITDAMVEICGSVEDRVHVIIDEVSGDNWGRGGVLLSEIQETPVKESR